MEELEMLNTVTETQNLLISCYLEMLRVTVMHLLNA